MKTKMKKTSINLQFKHEDAKTARTFVSGAPQNLRIPKKLEEKQVPPKPEPLPDDNDRVWQVFVRDPKQSKDIVYPPTGERLYTRQEAREILQTMTDEGMLHEIWAEKPEERFSLDIDIQYENRQAVARAAKEKTKGKETPTLGGASMRRKKKARKS